MQRENIRIPLENGEFLVAERNLDPDYNEIFVFIEDENGVAVQDLAIVGQQYGLANQDEDESPAGIAVRNIEDLFTVKVYADPYSEDYRQSFEIARYREEEV